jgi:hypothetical protein
MSSPYVCGMRLPSSWFEAWTGHDHDVRGPCLVGLAGQQAFRSVNPASGQRLSTPNSTSVFVTTPIAVRILLSITNSLFLD